jgi:uncharacterized protein YxjI
MAQLFIKANELEEKDTVRVFNERGKEVFYTRDDFIATGHRIKIFMADTITEVAYVQEKYDGDVARFEFAARDKFGTIERDFFTLAQNYNIDFDEDWEIVGDAIMWNYVVKRGSLDVMKVRNDLYLIPGQALNLTPTYIMDIVVESDILIGLAFVLAVYALNKYSY